MKHKILKISIIIGFCLIFPTAFTLFSNRSDSNIVTKTKSSGKTIVIENNSQTIKMDMEDFIPCILVNQLSIDAPAEAIKAQSVVIRTYILNHMKSTDSINASSLGLPFTLYEDLKNIVGDDYSNYYTTLKNSVNETSGEVIKYDGQLITPYFHSISAGKTRNGEEALFSSDYPYLISKDSTSDTSMPNYLNIIYIEKSEFANKLKGYNEQLIINLEDPLESSQVLSRCSAGYISSIQLGNQTFTGDEIQMIFSLTSPYFELETYENQIRIICKGNGHGLGLSLSGSIAMATEGSSYKEILTYYYTDVTIEK